MKLSVYSNEIISAYLIVLLCVSPLIVRHIHLAESHDHGQHHVHDAEIHGPHLGSSTDASDNFINSHDFNQNTVELSKDLNSLNIPKFQFYFFLVGFLIISLFYSKIFLQRIFVQKCQKYNYCRFFVPLSRAPPC